MKEEDQEQCIRQFVLSVKRNVKFRSNLMKADLSTAKNVGQRKDPQEEMDIKLTR